MPSAQYNPASLPPAMTDVNLAMSSGVAKKLRSITIISSKGPYFTFTSFFTITFHAALLVFLIVSSLLIFPCFQKKL